MGFYEKMTFTANYKHEIYDTSQAKNTEISFWYSLDYNNNQIKIERFSEFEINLAISSVILKIFRATRFARHWVK